MNKKQGMRTNILRILEENPDTYFPPHYFLGERQIETTGEWVFFSYKAPTRLTEIHQAGHTDRRWVKGKSGAMYYEYKLK